MNKPLFILVMLLPPQLAFATQALTTSVSTHTNAEDEAPAQNAIDSLAAEIMAYINARQEFADTLALNDPKGFAAIKNAKSRNQANQIFFDLFHASKNFPKGFVSSYAELGKKLADLMYMHRKDDPQFTVKQSEEAFIELDTLFSKNNYRFTEDDLKAARKVLASIWNGRTNAKDHGDLELLDGCAVELVNKITDLAYTPGGAVGAIINFNFNSKRE